MNSFSLIALVILNFVAIGLLPILFFRGDGQFNLRWFATGAPFFVVPSSLLLGQFGFLEPYYHAQAMALVVVQAIAVFLSVVSIALIAMTVGTHRIPLALWHQDNDAPVELVTWGPYSKIRHPFYTSFILAFTAAVFAFPHAITAACFGYALVALTITARREEHRLSTSSFAAEYRRYMSGAGRFFPRIMS